MALQSPMNYGIDIPDAAASFEQGILWRQQQNAQIKQRKEAEAIQQEIAALGPNPSAAAVTALTEKYPQLAERFKGMLGRLNAEDYNAKLEQAIPVTAAMKSGNYAVAENLLRQQAEGLRNSGKPEEAKKIETLADLVRDSPDVARPSIITTTGIMMNSHQPGSFEATFGQYDKAEESAATVEKTRAETRRESANAALKEIEAQFAPEKIAADLGLTNAQTEQARAAAIASRANARKTNAEIAGIGTGVLPPDKRAELELKLRNEYANRTGSYKDVKEAYSRVLASEPNPAGDIALVFNFMKMLDPGSAVREGEYATAQNATNIPDRIRNAYNKAITGEGLNPNQRTEFSTQAKSLYAQARVGEQTIRKGLSRIAGTYGITPDAIFYEATETAPAPPAGAPTAPPPAAVVPPSSATVGGVGSVAMAPVRVTW